MILYHCVTSGIVIGNKQYNIYVYVKQVRIDSCIVSFCYIFTNIFVHLFSKLKNILKYSTVIWNVYISPFNFIKIFSIIWNSFIDIKTYSYSIYWIKFWNVFLSLIILLKL